MRFVRVRTSSRFTTRVRHIFSHFSCHGFCDIAKNSQRIHTASVASWTGVLKAQRLVHARLVLALGASAQPSEKKQFLLAALCSANGTPFSPWCSFCLLQDTTAAITA